MFAVVTDHPLASDSPDHLHPLGAVRDNSRNPRFVAKALKRGVSRLLDLGCAGGGMVGDFIRQDASVQAIGLEGSDLPNSRNLGEWPRLGGTHLFTADIAFPFSVLYLGRSWEADLVTAWEFLEHVEDRRIGAVMENVRRHLAPGGLFVASIATFPDPPRHQTVRPSAWWLERLAGLGFVNDPSAVDDFAPDWVRDQGARGLHVAMRAVKVK